jgi:alanyl-tRNA synthetase
MVAEFMNADELREAYLSFFESKGCVRRPTDVLVPKDDPTILFTPAGMNQFKNQFLGLGPLEFTRATTCQKCLRTGDIGNVGVTAYHHTFFEMLGNFSFGDYFKREAIHWAWEFLTSAKWLKLDPKRLSVTVYLDDDEAANIWHKEIGLALEQISREDEHENFWPAAAPSQGPDGVCGPCSEIYYHPPSGGKKVEIWNLVFTQFNRVGDPPNNLRPLPKKNIDTGMGLERTASVLQGHESNFEIDSLRPLCMAAGETVGAKYEFTAPQGRALRRIADHVRACTFAMHEGCVPSNSREGYVVKLLLRRAFMEGYLLGRQEPFLYQLVPTVADLMKKPYPELRETIESVQTGIREEERQFLSTIDQGLQRFKKIVEQTRSAGSNSLSGDDVFDLHQTYGFLVEITETLATREQLTVDRERFEQRMEEHHAVSGRGAFADSVMSEGPLDALRKSSGGTVFVGYEQTESQSVVLGVIADKALVDSYSRTGVSIGLVLDETPFYGESGGQVGDTGAIVGKDFEFTVQDVQKDGDLFVHIGQLTRGKISTGAEVTAKVDVERRAAIRRAHSATHLLHAALRETLGENATQRGSKVEADQLRFDFAHPKGLAPEELLKIEDSINRRISEGAVVSTQLMPIGDARNLGAMALFGEKYPDNVRVVRMGDFSTELCGGTHLTNTGQVGLCRVVKDELVSAGVRRISCLTGPRALNRLRELEAMLKESAALAKAAVVEELPRKVAQLQDELRQVKRELSKYTGQSLVQLADKLVAEAPLVGSTRLIVHRAEGISREALKELVDHCRAKSDSAAVLVGMAVEDDKVALIAGLTKDLVAKGIKASDIVKAAAKVAGGGGGGRPDLAEAGGRFPEKLDEALETGAAALRAALAEG